MQSLNIWQKVKGLAWFKCPQINELWTLVNRYLTSRDTPLRVPLKDPQCHLFQYNHLSWFWLLMSVSLRTKDLARRFASNPVVHPSLKNLWPQKLRLTDLRGYNRNISLDDNDKGASGPFRSAKTCLLPDGTWYTFWCVLWSQLRILILEVPRCSSPSMNGLYSKDVCLTKGCAPFPRGKSHSWTLLNIQRSSHVA